MKNCNLWNAISRVDREKCGIWGKVKVFKDSARQGECTKKVGDIANKFSIELQFI